MISIKNMIKACLFLFHFCTGQFLYTGLQEIENWELSSINKSSSTSKDSLNLWLNYKKRKNPQNNELHHFGLFIKLSSGSKTILPQEKSNLIGNGLLTNYKFSISNLEIVNSMFFTNDRKHAMRGFVRTIKDVTMYTNQAYFKYYNHLDSLKYNLKVGRDFLYEGFSNESRIFFSDYSRPFDQFSIEANFKKLKSKIALISLDSIADHKRYLYMHTIGYSSDKINLTIGEAIISSGVNESINLSYLNPFSLWSWENIGSTISGINAFLYSGFSFRFNSTSRLYGEVLIDDVNFHQKNAFFLNRYGYMLGFQKTSFPFSASNIWAEFSNILDQVYQSFHPSHIYTHNGFPVGHFFGNDFINYRLRYTQLFNSKISKVFVDFSYLIKGNNGLETPFDNPWEDRDGNFNYSYKHPGFPTPPLSFLYDLNFGIEVELNKLTFLTITFENQKYFNDGIQSRTSIRFWSYLKIKK